MRLFVVGKLGEIVKKVIELENVIKHDPTNTFVLAEYAAYQKVLEMWPVLDKGALVQAVDIFKYNLANLKEKEKALRENTDLAFYDLIAKNRYFTALEDVKASMHHINKLGEYIGSTPILEVEDAELVGNDS